MHHRIHYLMKEKTNDICLIEKQSSMSVYKYGLRICVGNKAVEAKSLGFVIFQIWFYCKLSKGRKG